MNDAVKALFPNIELQNKKDYLTIEGAVEEFSLSTSTIYRRFENRTLTKVKSSGRTLLKRNEIMACMKEIRLCAINERGRGKRGRK